MVAAEIPTFKKLSLRKYMQTTMEHRLIGHRMQEMVLTGVTETFPKI